MRLKRVRAGSYRTLDGLFSFALHPYQKVWLVYDESDTSECMWFNGMWGFPCLWEAKMALAEFLAKQPKP